MICPECGAEFVRGARYRYCSPACSDTAARAKKKRNQEKYRLALLAASTPPPLPPQRPHARFYRATSLAGTPDILARPIRDDALTGSAAAVCSSYSKSSEVAG